jgi:hypothetical protein
MVFRIIINAPNSERRIEEYIDSKYRSSLLCRCMQRRCCNFIQIKKISKKVWIKRIIRASTAFRLLPQSA